MFLILEITLCLTIAILWWFKNDKQRYAKYPPGPKRWPIVGNLPQLATLDPFPSTALKQLSYKYGDVFFMKMGEKESVVFNTLETAKEMLTHEAASFRTDKFEFVRARSPGKETLGVIWGNGKTWQNLRRFTMRNLRDFGFGKSSVMDVVINEEIDKFVTNLKGKLRKTNHIFDEQDLFTVTLINVLWRLACGKSYDLDDPVIAQLVQLNRDFMGSTVIGVDVGEFWPVTRTLFPNWTKATQQIDSCKALYEYGKRILKENRELGTYKSNPESFIDVFLEKLEEGKNDPATDFKDEQFIMVILDLLLGGSETSSNTLHFGIVYMVMFPEVQEKVYYELTTILGKDEMITNDMKTRLPYTTATTLEILRFSTVVPLPSPREATEDFYFRGKYFIPKGMALQPNVSAIHRDPELWGDPENFRPDRFLNKAGTEIDTKVTEKLLSFGAGKRYCLGQSLAEVTMFLYFAEMVRRFKFSKVPGSHPTTTPIVGLTLVPTQFPIKMEERS